MTRDENSIEAYHSTDATRGYMERLIASYIAKQGPRTCTEIEDELGLLHQSASAAIRALVKKDRLMKVGKDTNRRGRTVHVYDIKRAKPVEVYWACAKCHTIAPKEQVMQPSTDARDRWRWGRCGTCDRKRTLHERVEVGA